MKPTIKTVHRGKRGAALSLPGPAKRLQRHSGATVRHFERPSHRKRLYGTREVALIVHCPEWRVKNFAQSAYGLPPSQMLGSGGRGSRRLYSFHDVMRIAIADELVLCGFSPEAVGSGVREIPQSVLTKWADILIDESRQAELPMLVARRGKWSVMKAGEISALFVETVGEALHGNDLFVLNIASVLEDALRRLVNLEGEGKIKP